MEEIKDEKPLTLSQLAQYTQEVLLPAMDDRYVTKKEFNEFKNESKDFKNEMLGHIDAILKKLDILLTEKTIRDHQEKKQKELLAIMVRALKDHQILSTDELDKIARLEFF